MNPYSAAFAWQSRAILARREVMQVVKRTIAPRDRAHLCAEANAESQQHDQRLADGRQRPLTG